MIYISSCDAHSPLINDTVKCDLQQNSSMRQGSALATFVPPCQTVRPGKRGVPGRPKMSPQAFETMESAPESGGCRHGREGDVPDGRPRADGMPANRPLARLRRVTMDCRLPAT